MIPKWILDGEEPSMTKVNAKNGCNFIFSSSIFGLVKIPCSCFVMIFQYKCWKSVSDFLFLSIHRSKFKLVDVEKRTVTLARLDASIAIKRSCVRTDCPKTSVHIGRYCIVRFNFAFLQVAFDKLVCSIKTFVENGGSKSFLIQVHVKGKIHHICTLPTQKRFLILYLI